MHFLEGIMVVDDYETYFKIYPDSLKFLFTRDFKRINEFAKIRKALNFTFNQLCVLNNLPFQKYQLQNDVLEHIYEIWGNTAKFKAKYIGSTTLQDFYDHHKHPQISIQPEESKNYKKTIKRAYEKILEKPSNTPNASNTSNTSSKCVNNLNKTLKRKYDE